MKKLLIGLGVIFLFSSITFADGQPTTTGYVSGKVVGSLADLEASGVTVGASDLLVGDELTVIGTFTMPNGILNVTDVFDDVPAAGTADHFDFDITTTTLVAGTTSISGGAITDPIIPMNVTAQVLFDVGNTTAAVASTLTIIGYDARGEAQTETISVSTTAASGVKAWSDFTSFAYSNSTVTGRATVDVGTDASLQIGIGTILGLGNSITASGFIRDSGDVIWAQLNDSGTTTADDATCNTTYNTWTPDTAGDGAADVYTIRYKVEAR